MSPTLTLDARRAVQYAEDDFTAWATESFSVTEPGLRDELQTLALMAGEIRRHQEAMTKLWRSLDVSDHAASDRYLPQTMGYAEIEGLQNALCPEAMTCVQAHFGDLGDILGTVPASPKPVTTQVRSLDPSLYSDLSGECEDSVRAVA